MKKTTPYALFLLVLLVFPSIPQAEYDHAPIDIQAKLFLKLFLFNNDLNQGEDVVIHVIDAPAFAAEIKKAVGMEIGKSRLSAVTEGHGLPDDPPSVLYLGTARNLASVIAYTQGRKVLSITGIPELVTEGVTLGVGVEKKKPKILFNLSASEKEGMDWNPVILKIATVVK